MRRPGSGEAAWAGFGARGWGRRATRSPLEYAFQILLVNEFHGLPKGYFHFTDPSDKHSTGIPVSGDTILITFGFFPGGNMNNYITLAGILAGSLGASFFLLKSGTFKN